MKNFEPQNPLPDNGEWKVWASLAIVALLIALIALKANGVF